MVREGKRADWGNAQAQHFLGECYQVGWSRDIKVDLRYACAWYQLAEDYGYEGATGEAKRIAQFLPQAELETARSLYREFKKKYSVKRELHARPT